MGSFTCSNAKYVTFIMLIKVKLLLIYDSATINHRKDGNTVMQKYTYTYIFSVYIMVYIYIYNKYIYIYVYIYI